MKTYHNGFTLIEVLIAIAIASIVAGALFSTYLAIHNVISSVEGSSVKLRETRNILDMLSRELSSAYVDNNDKKTFFVLKDLDIYGKPASMLRFTAFSDNGLTSITYEIKELENGKRLVLTKKAGPAFRDERIEAELVEDIEGFLVEVQSGENWLRTWDTELTGRLPEKIKITILFNINQRKIELSQTAIPRLR